MPAITLADFTTALAEFTKRPAPPVTVEDTLASLHLDSLAMLEIIGLIEERFGIEANEDDLVDLKRVGDLLRVLSAAPKRAV